MSTKLRFRRPKKTVSLTHGASATTGTTSISENGLLREVIINAPATVDASATLTVNILDSDSNVIYAKTGIAAAATSINLLTNDLRVPLCGTETIQAVFSAAQTVTDTVTTVTLLVDQG